MKKKKSRNPYYTDLRKEYPRTWRIWYRMNKRCRDNQLGYVEVSVCDDWNIDISKEEGFINFVDDMGPSEKELEIDRINPFGDYEPNNCRWTSRTVQTQNTRARAQGDYKYLELAHKNNICRATFYSRIERGWNPKDAATLPPEQKRYKDRIL